MFSSDLLGFPGDCPDALPNMGFVNEEEPVASWRACPPLPPSAFASVCSVSAASHPYSSLGDALRSAWSDWAIFSAELCCSPVACPASMPGAAPSSAGESGAHCAYSVRDSSRTHEERSASTCFPSADSTQSHPLIEAQSGIHTALSVSSARVEGLSVTSDPVGDVDHPEKLYPSRTNPLAGTSTLHGESGAGATTRSFISPDVAPFGSKCSLSSVSSDLVGDAESDGPLRRPPPRSILGVGAYVRGFGNRHWRNGR